MQTYETTATVGEHGQVHLAGVPFEPGTRIGVTISPQVGPAPEGPGEDVALAARRERMRELFRTIKGFRMVPRCSREEIYDRKCFR